MRRCEVVMRLVPGVVCAQRENITLSQDAFNDTSTPYTINMAGLEADSDTKEEKLKAALWYAIGQSVDSFSVNNDFNATPHFIGALSELVWSQIENVAQDVEAFARHSGRPTISSNDVVLLGRRNDDLKDLLQKEADRVRGNDKTTK